MRKRVGVLLGVLIAVVLLVATAQAGSKRSQVDTVTLSGWSSSPEENDLLQQVVDTFNRTHKTVQINYSVINGDYATAMTARFAAHNPPDVFYVDSSRAGAWAQQGVLEPLNAYIKQSKYKASAFFPSLLSAFTVGKQVYGFPKDWSPLAMEINKGMLGQAGGKAPTNWAQLQKVAQQMESKGVVNGGKPICLSPDWARMLAFVYQNKGSLTNLTSPAAIQAVNFYVGLINKGLAATPDKLGAGWCGEALGKGKAAIIFEGNWVIPFMKSTYPNVQYGIFPMVKQKTSGNLAFTVSYSMAKDAKNKQAAWTVLSWLTGPAGQKIWTSKGLALPSRKDIKAVGGRQAFLSQAKYAHGWGFGNPNFDKANTVMNNDLSAVISGNKSVAAMMADVQAALKGQ
ncbi:MAG TPA: ABC transporter substrate-binding protein [Gaiellaceae bacterium]|nr:ABC transporter substrate-binding protein [Gaiellaceae bacterium]